MVFWCLVFACHVMMITLALLWALRADKQTMNWVRAYTDTRYAKREGALDNRDGKQCGRTKGGEMQCGERVVVILSVEEKWAAERDEAERRSGKKEELTRTGK